MARTLFTIGYEHAPSGAVLEELKRTRVALLVDVRAVAASRRPGFAKSQLKAGLDAHGIGYLHLRALGTPKEGREAARGGDYRKLQAIYEKHLATPDAREQLDELAALVRKAGPICILCYERDPAHCHRQWIAEAIEERTSIRTRHLQAPL